MTQNAWMEYVLGLGGFWLDPGGAATLCRRVAALGVHVPTPFPQNSLVGPAQSIDRAPADAKIFLAGDSCGVTRIIELANDRPHITFAAMYCIQGSVWCKDWSARGTIPANVKTVHVFYSNWLLTWGLGVWRPQCKVMASGINYYDGKLHPANNGQTMIAYHYVPDLHPADNDVHGVQDPIVASIKEMLK